MDRQVKRELKALEAAKKILGLLHEMEYTVEESVSALNKSEQYLYYGFKCTNPDVSEDIEKSISILLEHPDYA